MNDSAPENIAAAGALSTEQAKAIGGGSCTTSDILDAINHLTDAYESLVDFTSHVIERVAG